jgi:hypothetical protein
MKINKSLICGIDLSVWMMNHGSNEIYKPEMGEKQIKVPLASFLTKSHQAHKSKSKESKSGSSWTKASLQLLRPATSGIRNIHNSAFHMSCCL